MPILDLVRKDLVLAMKEKDKIRLDCLRFIIKDVKEAEIKNSAKLSDEGTIKVIEKIIKQCHESEDDFKKYGRSEQAQQELDKIKILESYLPKAPTEAELIAIIDQTLQDFSAPSKSDLGKIMTCVKNKLPVRANLKFVTDFLKNKLS